MRKQIALFLVLAMMLCMIPCVSAAADQARIVLDAGFVETDVYVTVRLEQAANVTNGRLVLDYDADAATLLKVQKGAAVGRLSDNHNSAGQVSIAWVGSDFTGEDSQVVTLVFRPEKAQDLHFAAACPEVYAGKEAVQARETKAYVAWNPFTDISGHWAEEAIVEGWHRGIVHGVTDTKFQPDGRLSRGMFVTILHRMAGCPAAKLPAGFTDVSADRYYTEAVNWAVEAGVAEGTGYGEFKPHKDLTRQEMVTMLYRYAKAMEMDVSADQVLDQFRDAAKVAPWAQDAMNWAIDNGVIHGMSSTRLAPEKITTRAQIVTVLCRFLAE